MKNKLALILLLILSSCTFFTDDSGDIVTIDSKSQKLSIVFSHNINGETHPCGCRHFPLGGFPSVAGVFEEIKKEGPVVYVDTGDMLFPSNNIPESLHESLSFTANNVAEGSKRIGLSLIVPGDQDLSRGLDFMHEVFKKRDITIFCANFIESAQKKVGAKGWTKVEHGPHKIYFVGLVFPQIFPKQHRNLFINPVEAMKKTLAELKKDGYDESNKFHRLILLSHGGMDRDKEFVKKFKNIDWVIGAHSQSFVREPKEEGKTKLVQVLSRNHHLGQVIIDLQKSKEADTYKIHEVRDELKEKLKPNPYIKFIDDHKKKLTEIQLSEQSKLSSSEGFKRLTTANTCIECHDAQGEFWQGTAHSIAYATLLNAGEKANMTCIKCHSVGANDPHGFVKSKDIINFKLVHDHDGQGEHSHEGAPKGKELEDLEKKYWAKVSKIVPKGTSVRELSIAKTKEYSKSWQAADEEFHVSHNFANVQCLNCHAKHPEHPFNMNKKEMTAQEVKAGIKAKCLECHDPDQSPQWYGDGKGGSKESLKADVFDAHYKSMSCPRAE